MMVNASNFTGYSAVCPKACPYKWQRRGHQISSLFAPCGGKPPVTGTWWRHKWKHFPRNWPFVRGIHRSPVNSPHKGQWRGALMFSLIFVWINDRVNNREAGDSRRYRAHYDAIVMVYPHKVPVMRKMCPLLSWLLTSSCRDTCTRPAAWKRDISIRTHLRPEVPFDENIMSPV